jgi:GNAT superfamily N-acetyltransferase
MTDPAGALALFQEAFAQGQIPVQPGRLDSALLFAPDRPNGRPRFNYMRSDGRTLRALVMFAQNGTEDGHPIFNVGYAVAESFRGQGLAKSTLAAALAELTDGMGAAGIPCIHVEAVIDVDHVVSQRVAKTIFNDTPIRIIDSISGLPALHFTRKIALNKS